MGLKGEAWTLQGMCHHNNVKGLAAAGTSTLGTLWPSEPQNLKIKAGNYSNGIASCQIPDSFRHVCLSVDEGPFELSTNKMLCPAMGDDIWTTAISCNHNKFHASEIVQKDAKGMIKPPTFQGDFEWQCFHCDALDMILQRSYGSSNGFLAEGILSHTPDPHHTVMVSTHTPNKTGTRTMAPHTHTHLWKTM